MNYYPVYIPTLNRFEHFSRCLNSLEKCVGSEQTDVYIGLDYPPTDKYVDGWKKIDAYLKEKEQKNGFKNLFVRRREHNCGVGKVGSNSMLLFEEVHKKYDCYIFSEDDNIFSPNFLVYMNKCLDEFKDNPDIIGVTGYSYPVEWTVSNGATCFKQNFNASMWGTGFWRDKDSKLQEYISSGKLIEDLPHVLKNKTYRNMIDACFIEYITATVSPLKLLRSQTDMAVRATLAVNNKYFISPVISKVKNLGFDGSGYYCQTIDESLNGVTAGTYNYSNQPIDKEDTFNIILDEFNNTAENRQRLNEFDVRTKEQTREARFLLWLMENIGIWSAKTYYLLKMPLFIVNKIWHRINR